MIRRPLMTLTLGVVALPLLALIVTPGMLVPALLIALAVHAVAAFATFVPRSQIWGPVVTGFDSGERGVVWLTIDDGPADDTPEFLEVLARQNARATFFVTGRNVERRPGHVASIVEAGHEAACHTYSHPAGWFWAYTRAAARRQIVRCNALIESETSTRVVRFRPPVGFRNGFTHDVLEELGMELVSWRRRGNDGIESGRPSRVVERIVRGLAPGDVIMMHQGRPSSVAILEQLLEELRRRNLRCVVPDARGHFPTGG